MFGFSEYLAALALLLVVISASDFRYRLRLQLAPFDATKVAFTGSLVIGLALLAVDAWSHNSWLIPAWLNDPNNVRLVLGLGFFGIVSYLVYAAFIQEPKFSRLNARAVFGALQSYVARANPEQLGVIADWLEHAVDDLVSAAAARSSRNASCGGTLPVCHKDYAAYTLSLLASPALCRQMAAASPWTIARLFDAAGRHVDARLPIVEFARNIGTELVRNSNSALYQEADGFEVGFLGYSKQITQAVYGNFDLVDALASHGGSPLDIHWELVLNSTEQQFKAYCRAFMTFFAAYAAEPWRQHSYGLYRAVHQIKDVGCSIRQLNSRDDYGPTEQFLRFRHAVDTLRDMVGLLENMAVPRKRRWRKSSGSLSAHSLVAASIYDLIESAAYVSTPWWTSWSIQHNELWSRLFGRTHRNSPSWRLVKYHLRRLLYDEIKEFERQPNFVNARVVGYCLNVLEIASKDGDREFGIIRRAAEAATRSHYVELAEEYPAVAAVMLMGGWSYEREERRLVKTYASRLGKEGRRSYFLLEESKKVSASRGRGEA